MCRGQWILALWLELRAAFGHRAKVDKNNIVESGFKVGCRMPTWIPLTERIGLAISKQQSFIINWKKCFLSQTMAPVFKCMPLDNIQRDWLIQTSPEASPLASMVAWLIQTSPEASPLASTVAWLIQTSLEASPLASMVALNVAVLSW